MGASEGAEQCQEHFGPKAQRPKNRYNAVTANPRHLRHLFDIANRSPAQYDL
jgi:hypothetical protein